METAIDHHRIFYTVYQKNQSRSLPHFKVIGAYSDIRDAIQGMASHYRRHGGDYAIESSPNKPYHWIHPSRYRN